MRRTIEAVAVLGLFAVLFVGVRAAPQGTSDSSGDRVTLLLMLGVNSSAPERWDGSVEVANGQIVSMDGRHFSGLDKITGPNSWACMNRRDEVGGFPRVNYTEMSPAELPPVLYFPVGIYVTLEAAPSTRVSVKTAQGDFRISAVRRRRRNFGIPRRPRHGRLDPDGRAHHNRAIRRR